MAGTEVNNLKALLMGDPNAETEIGKEGYLKSRKQSVEQFSRDIGVTRTMVYHYLSDKSRPSLNTLVRICEALGISLSLGTEYCTPRNGGRQPKA